MDRLNYDAAQSQIEKALQELATDTPDFAIIVARAEEAQRFVRDYPTVHGDGGSWQGFTNALEQLKDYINTGHAYKTEHCLKKMAAYLDKMKPVINASTEI